MTQYLWESSGQTQKKGPKATGTVVFNPNDHFSTKFEDQKHLSEETRQVLTGKKGFEGFLPAQAQSFGGISNGRDVILHSRTGSGKTLAYVLPVLERFLREKAALPVEEASVNLSTPAAPYLLVFVFGNELAVQTKSVIQSVYGSRVNVAVAGFDEVTLETPVDVLIGTLGAVDHLVRGRKGTKGSTKHSNDADEGDSADDSEDDASEDLDEDDDSDDEDDEGLEEMDEFKTPGQGAKAAPPAGAKRSTGSRPSDKLEKLREARRVRVEQSRNQGIVSLARVRCVAIDEVDVTMGPKFSGDGRRMKNLLKVLRRSNGSLSANLTSDVRMHHYVLCGATIPNWVIKAGFLGIKKYYYRLVTAGDAKLPKSLECHTYTCPREQRLVALNTLLRSGKLGRTVVFTTGARVDLVEGALKKSAAEVTAASSADKKKAGVKKSAALASLDPIVRTLSSAKTEVERIACIEDFNSGAANVLLCTDAASRGLDFVAVDSVVMETLPEHVGSCDTFVHRAGRSARVNNAGRCLLLMDPKLDQQRVAKLESVLHVTFTDFGAMHGLSASSSSTKKTTSNAATCKLGLAVGKVVGSSKAGATPMTPKAVLDKCVDPKLLVAVHPTDAPHRVELEVKTQDREAVRKALWKYNVSIL